MLLKKIGLFAIIGLINIYQHAIGPFLPKVCRFYPTCSEYSKQALKTYGLTKGIILSLKRILRCNPFCQGGYDPLIKE